MPVCSHWLMFSLMTWTVLGIDSTYNSTQLQFMLIFVCKDQIWNTWFQVVVFCCCFYFTHLFNSSFSCSFCIEFRTTAEHLLSCLFTNPTIFYWCSVTSWINILTAKVQTDRRLSDKEKNCDTFESELEQNQHCEHIFVSRF